MTNKNPIFAALASDGFVCCGSSCCGVWKGYAVALQLYSGRNYYVHMAIRTAEKPTELMKALRKSLKGRAPKGCAVMSVTARLASFVMPFSKPKEASSAFAAAMEAFIAALRENGLAPADTCALTGAARPDSLGLLHLGRFDSYQPVCASAVRALGDRARERAEENQNNGSYATGFVGALLGMLIGLIPNVLMLVASQRIYALLFALVPLAAMFGYKLFKGKMSKGALVIVILLSVLGVVLIPFLELVILLAHEYGATVGQAFAASAQLVGTADYWSELGGTMLQLLLFMALGVLVAWRYMFGQINSTQMLNVEAQIASLRPNPNREQDGI